MPMWFCFLVFCLCFHFRMGISCCHRWPPRPDRRSYTPRWQWLAGRQIGAKWRTIHQLQSFLGWPMDKPMQMAWIIDPKQVMQSLKVRKMIICIHKLFPDLLGCQGSWWLKTEKFDSMASEPSLVWHWNRPSASAIFIQQLDECFGSTKIQRLNMIVVMWELESWLGQWMDASVCQSMPECLLAVGYSVCAIVSHLHTFFYTRSSHPQIFAHSGRLLVSYSSRLYTSSTAQGGGGSFQDRKPFLGFRDGKANRVAG